MTDLVKSDEIESILGVPRHPTRHRGRADTTKSIVYILHSAECLASGRDLRECEYSLALDAGIDGDRWVWSKWCGVLDKPVPLRLVQVDLVGVPSLLPDVS